MSRYSIDFVTQAPLVPELRLREIVLERYGITEANFTPLTGYDDLNFKLDQCQINDSKNPALAKRQNESFVLKISNPVESRNLTLMDAQNDLMKHLTDNGIPCPQALPQVDGRMWSLVALTEKVTLPVRLFTFLPGKRLEEVGYLTAIYRKVGETLARFHVTTEAFSRPVFREHYPALAVENWDGLEQEFHVLCEKGMINTDRANLCAKVFDETKRKILAHKDQFEHGLIHSDLNETNLLLTFEPSTSQYEVSGLLDFGDAHHSLRVFDIANAILYLLLDVKTEAYDAEWFRIGDDLLDGYRRVREPCDLQAVGVSMRARLVSSLVYGLRTARINARNGDVDYILKTQSNGWKVLKVLCSTDLTKFGLSFQ
ncbi:Aminoglycoside phosphotransferase [Aphelenchoides avenae]|nr:Aminoglycoside phosphotransferase [Aphelenchus avenae]